MFCEINLPINQSKNIKRVPALSVTYAELKLKNKCVVLQPINKLLKILYR